MFLVIGTTIEGAIEEVSEHEGWNDFVVYCETLPDAIETAQSMEKKLKDNPERYTPLGQVTIWEKVTP